MKRVVSLVLVLMLCVSVCAMAEYVPSKRTSDMVEIEFEGDNIPEDADLKIKLIVDEEEYAELIEICQKEIDKLRESESIEAYFGEIKDIEGNILVLSEMLDAEVLNVFEFLPLVVENYDPSYGNIRVTFLFNTPYELDEKVIALIGIMNEETLEMDWTALEGVGVGEEGAVQVEFTPELFEAIQNGTAMIAIVSD